MIDDTTRMKLQEELLSPNLHIGKGLGSVSGERCTIAEINFVLTGNLTDHSHPCISEVIRKWVICVQDEIPDEMRNSVAWRSAAIGIAGSAVSDEVEQRRATLILDWMWNALADEAVVAAIPQNVRPAWDTMLTERTAEAAYAARAAADAAYAAYAAAAAARADAAARAAYADDAARAAANAVGYAVYATYAANAAAFAAAFAADAAGYVDASYWERRNPAQLLTELIEISQEGE